MTNFEGTLQRINRFVTIDKDDRRVYTRDFDVIRYRIFTEMRNLDPAFKIIASSQCLGGSYADNLKVSKPDEFDLVLQLDFPDHSLIEIESVGHLPGFVTLNVTNLLRKIRGEVHNQPLYRKLQELIDDDGYLVQWEFQKWMQSIVDTVLNIFPERPLDIDGVEYFIKRRSIQGPAQTLEIEVESRRFSVDFVPALRFPTSAWPADRPCPEQGRDKPWIAVPKPLKSDTIGYNPNNLYWITSFVDQERYLIERRNFLKPSIRLLKKLRDRHDLTNLKSYYIKTVFLWILEKKQKGGDYNFGSSGLATTFLIGFEMLLKYFEDECLPFFWDDDFDMLDKLNEAQKYDIYYKLKDIHRKILRSKDTDLDKLFEIFLTPEQLESLREGKTSIIEEERKSSQWSCTII